MIEALRLKISFNGQDEEIVEARAKGIEPLAFGENGFRHWTNSKRPLATPDDMKGLKIRVPGMKMYISLFKAMGADPTSMSFSEVFTALQQGTVDGQENPIPTIYLSKYNEVQKFVTLTGHVYSPAVMLMNKASFDKLSAADQAAFIEAAKEAVKAVARTTVRRARPRERSAHGCGPRTDRVQREPCRRDRSRRSSRSARRRRTWCSCP